MCCRQAPSPVCGGSCGSAALQTVGQPLSPRQPGTAAGTAPDTAAGTAAGTADNREGCASAAGARPAAADCWLAGLLVSAGAWCCRARGGLQDWRAELQQLQQDRLHCVVHAHRHVCNVLDCLIPVWKLWLKHSCRVPQRMCLLQAACTACDVLSAICPAILL